MSFSLRRAGSARVRRPLIATIAVAGTALAATALAGPAHAATTQYKLTLDPAATQYLSINNNGDIIGEAGQPFVMKAGGPPLFLNPPASQAGRLSVVTAENVNNAGQVVGESDTGEFTALEWPAGSSTPTDLSKLPTLAKDFFTTQATAINDSGLIAGFGEGPGTKGNITEAFTIQGSTVKILPLLPNGSDANAIAMDNTGTTIAGQAGTATTDPLAVEWVNGLIKLLPSLPNTLTSKALAVNSSGEAVGAALNTADLNAHAVLWANGTATDLHFGNAGDAEATSINASGVIVGDGGGGDGFGHAFINQNGVTTDLNTLIPAGSGVTLATAARINDSGVIVGTAVNAQGHTEGYKLTPVS